MSFISDLIESALAAVAFIARTFYQLLFNISPLYTEGVWPFGRPIAPSASVVDFEIAINGGLVAFSASQAYDKVAPTQGGEILIFSLMIFFFGYVAGGYLQFFDWKIENPKRKRDPVNGFFLLLFWFPIYYGVLGIIHALILTFPINLEDIHTLINGVLFSSAISSATPVSAILPFVVKLTAVGLFIIMFVMLIRPIVIAVYLLFGQVLIAIGWADIPKASDTAVDLLIKSIPVALVPLPMYFMMFLYSFAISGYEILGHEVGGWFTAETIVYGTGIFVLCGGVWITLWLMWVVFTRTGQYVEQAGQSVGQIGGTLGFVAMGRHQDASRAARYGPESVIGRQAFNRASNWRGESGERSDGDGGGSRGFTDRVSDFWGGDDGSRD